MMKQWKIFLLLAADVTFPSIILKEIKALGPEASALFFYPQMLAEMFQPCWSDYVIRIRLCVNEVQQTLAKHNTRKTCNLIGDMLTAQC